MPRRNRSCDAFQNAARLFDLRLPGFQRGVEHIDFLLPLADLQIRQLGARDRDAGFGLGDGDQRVAALELHQRLPRLDAVAAPHQHGLDLRHLDRRQQHIFAFDITDRERRRPLRWTAHPAGDQGQDAEKIVHDRALL